MLTRALRATPTPRAAPALAPRSPAPAHRCVIRRARMFGDDPEPDKDDLRRRSNKSPKGESFERANRRKGRPAWRRSPDDTPLRDGNRDRLMGLVTARAVRTLATYLSETNLNLYHWLIAFERAVPIPRDGSWDDVSGTTFLRTMLALPISDAAYDVGRDDMYNNFKGMQVDPRSMAQRIMEIRKAIAAEMREDLDDMTEENAIVLREAAAASLAATVDHPFDSDASATEDEEGGGDASSDSDAGGE